ncbi:MAG TPA: hypothetical protein VGO00_14145, partial [Kofleriaceae bacterium]|nr:hypothetical protein [Kofleriaceae bacterium]
APQVAHMTFDSEIYLEIADRPLGIDTAWASKPATVPVIYMVTGSDPETIVDVQAEVAFWAWAIAIAVLALALHSWIARGLAIGFGVAFVLAAPRVGWTGMVLSDSLNDSLMALVVACGIGLALVRGKHRRIVTGISIAIAILWIFARDTNAVSALVTIIAAALLWRVRTWWTKARWAVVLAAVVGVAAVAEIPTGYLKPDPFPFQSDWNPQLTARNTYLLINNVLIRMMHDDRDWLAERGAPVAELARFTDPEPVTDKLVQADAHAATAQTWIVEHGSGTYLRWLLRHPIDRAIELVEARWMILSSRYSLMPFGWIEHDRDHPAVDLVRRVTTNRWLILLLVLASPLLLWRPRASPLRGIAVCLIASGLLGAAAAYYGDAAELARHCYEPGQQIVLGLVIALVATIDAYVRRSRPSPAA